LPRVAPAHGVSKEKARWNPGELAQFQDRETSSRQNESGARPSFRTSNIRLEEKLRMRRSCG